VKVRSERPFLGEKSFVQQTLLIIKPDAVAKQAIGDILSRLEGEGFFIRQLRLVTLSKERAEAFYSVHKERPFFGELVEFMTSGPAVPVALERADAVAHLRGFIGETDSTKAAPGTIRADFGTDIQCNAVHGSDSPENAATEIAFFFAD
jgi:nucleoside-diphosphate kinase